MIHMAKRTKLTETMTEREFENGYWYAIELRAFATKVGIPSANKLRKDELEQALTHFIRTNESTQLVTRALSKSGPRDVDKGLRLDLPVVHYTSNKATKEFIQRGASRSEHGRYINFVSASWPPTTSHHTRMP
jgi:SAP domain-containing protein